MTFHDALTRFLEGLGVLGFADRTIAGYGADLAAFERFLGEVAHCHEVELAAVSPLWVEAHLARGRPTPSYRNRKLSALRSFFRFARRQGLIEEKDDPTRHVVFARVPRKEPSHLSFEEYLAVLQAAGRCSRPSLRLRNQAILVVLWNTGLRVSELTALNTAQFDGVRALLVGLRRKGGRVLDLPLNANASQALTVWHYARMGLYPSADGPLFVNTRRGRLSRRAVERIVARCAAEAGIAKPVTPHTFRHSHCTELQRRGAAMETARQLMDHRRIETTARYSHSTDEARRRALAALEDPAIFLLDGGAPAGVKTLLRDKEAGGSTCRPIPHWGT